MRRTDYREEGEEEEEEEDHTPKIKVIDFDALHLSVKTVCPYLEK